MLMHVITGTPIRQDSASFTVQEGDAVATYSRQFYRLAVERTTPAEPITLHMTEQLPLRLAGAEHMIAVPSGHV